MAVEPRARVIRIATNDVGNTTSLILSYPSEARSHGHAQASGCKASPNQTQFPGSWTIVMAAYRSGVPSRHVEAFLADLHEVAQVHVHVAQSHLISSRSHPGKSGLLSGWEKDGHGRSGRLLQIRPT